MFRQKIKEKMTKITRKTNCDACGKFGLCSRDETQGVIYVCDNCKKTQPYINIKQ